MHRLSITIAALLFTGSLLAGEANAQLFGERNLGSSLRGRSTTRSAGRNPGLDPSGRRFDRRSRRGGFVGTDRSDRRSFVGRNDAGPTPRVQSAVSGIRTAGGSSAANSVGQQQAIGQMYPPRLELASDLRASRDLRRVIDADTAIELANQLTELMDGSAIEVSVVDRIATIRGVVVSAKDRRRAEILASFEPGVSVVVNDLRLADGSEAPSMVAPPDPVPAPIEN